MNQKDMMAKEEEKFLKQNFAMMGEQVWASIKNENLDLQTTCKFFMGMPDFLEKADQKVLKDNALKFGKCQLATSIVGITLNIQFKKVPKINFLTWPFFLRYPTRMALFLSPNLGQYDFHHRTYNTVTDTMFKYHRRLEYFQKTGNFQYMDPTGELFDNFKKQNAGLQ